MPKWIPISLTIGALACLCLLLNPDVVSASLYQPAYLASFLLFAVSAAFAVARRRGQSPLSPALFLLLFFVAVPVLGTANYRQALESGAVPPGRFISGFAFATLIWSLGAASFFGGVLIGWRLLPGPAARYAVRWSRGRAVFLLVLSIGVALSGTAIAIARIGYVPLLRGDVLDVRTSYLEIVGPFAARFSGEFWIVPNLLCTTLFLLERRRRRFGYLALSVVAVLGTLVYAQRTGAVLAASMFVLLWLKQSRMRMTGLVAGACVCLVVVYALMIQAEYRGGFYSSRPVTERLIGHSFSEWQDYCLVIETCTRTPELGWRILVGPLLTLVPRQIFEVGGVDKMELIREYSAVYYYGREFGMLYGIRIGPTGEAFAAYGVGGVITVMLFCGSVFGALEKRYVLLTAEDGRLSGITYLLSLMLYLPIGSLMTLIGPLLHSGVAVLICYWLGTRRYGMKVAPPRAYRTGGRRMLARCSAEPVHE